MKKIIKITTSIICCIALLVTCVSWSNPQSVQGANTPSKKITIAIDPGHQQVSDLRQEAIDPDNKALGTKYKVTGGCTSAYNKMSEYRYNLIIATLLKKNLEKRGYDVFMTRSKHKVNVSNQTRAKRVNASGAKLCIRLHCDSINGSASGISTLYKPSTNSYYSKEDRDRSKVFAKYMLESCTKETGLKSRGIVGRNDLTAQNWSKIPVALIEMGFFSNYSEAKKMDTTKFKNQMVSGIGNAVDKYVDRYITK
ncbi:MAG: N-acetylmuramoyl-L-alanine amidase [Anaerovoracaceae bacterium]